MKDIRELIPDVETVVLYQAGGCYVMASDVQSQTDKLRRAVEKVLKECRMYQELIDDGYEPNDELDPFICLEIWSDHLYELTGEKWEEIDG